MYISNNKAILYVNLFIHVVRFLQNNDQTTVCSKVQKKKIIAILKRSTFKEFNYNSLLKY